MENVYNGQYYHTLTILDYDVGECDDQDKCNDFNFECTMTWMLPNGTTHARCQQYCTSCDAHTREKQAIH